MKKLKLPVLLLFLLVFLILLPLALLKPKNPPTIKITAESKEIEYTLGLNTWNGSKIDREDTFLYHMKRTLPEDLPYISLGKEIEIKFLGKVPDTVVLTDYILMDDGNVKYNIPPSAANPTPLSFKHKKTSFILSENFTALLSSQSADYEPGTTIRGFRIYCKDGKNDWEYGFIIRTDVGEQ